jgi:hypothetical protein
MRNVRRGLACTCIVVSLSFAPSALAAGVDPTSASADQKTQAMRHFKSGKDMLTAHKYDAALTELRASFDVVASPNVRLLIARCLRDMGKPAEAWTEYGATAEGARALAPKDAYYEKTAETADAEQKEVQGKIALVTVNVEHATDATKLTAAGVAIDRAHWGKPLAFAPGSVDFVVSADGKDVVKSQLAVAAGDTKSINLDAAPPKPVAEKPPAPPSDKPVADEDKPSFAPETPPPAPAEPKPTSLRPYAFVAGGVAVAGLVTFAIFGSLEKGTYSNLQSECKSGPCPPGHADEISSGRTQQTIANVGLVVGVAAAVTSGVLFVVSAPKSSPSSQTAIVVGPSFVGVRGSL